MSAVTVPYPTDSTTITPARNAADNGPTHPTKTQQHGAIVSNGMECKQIT